MPETVKLAVPLPVTVAVPGVIVSKPADAVRVTVSVVESASVTENLFPDPVKANVAPWATVAAAGLPRGVAVEIECVARL